MGLHPLTVGKVYQVPGGEGLMAAAHQDHAGESQVPGQPDGTPLVQEEVLLEHLQVRPVGVHVVGDGPDSVPPEPAAQGDHRDFLLTAVSLCTAVRRPGGVLDVNAVFGRFDAGSWQAYAVVEDEGSVEELLVEVRSLVDPERDPDLREPSLRKETGSLGLPEEVEETFSVQSGSRYDVTIGHHRQVWVFARPPVQSLWFKNKAVVKHFLS